MRTKADVNQVLSTKSDLTPWFTEFSVEAGLNIGSVEHEFFGHPVACVVAISSCVPDVVGKMRETFEGVRQNIRNLFPEGLAPNSLQAQFVLLHDDHEGPLQSALDKLRELHMVYGGQHCHLLKINSLDVMSVHRETGLQTYLSDADFRGIEDFTRHVTVSLVIPKLAEMLQTATKQLDAKKKTFSDTLATWWSGTKKAPAADEVIPPGSNLKYAPTSVVMLYRRVADCAFLLQCYELAQSAYKACAKEVKKNQDEWLAGCIEMSTVCSFLTNSAPREFEVDLEKAVRIYATCPGFQRFSLRCAILSASLCKASANFLRAGAFYADFAEGTQSPLVAALLQEQASICLLYLDPPRFRRLAFRLVFAARKYVAAQQFVHALRCYRYAQGVYMDHDWRMIDDHIRFNLGRHLASIGRNDEALALFQQLLSDSVASKERQASYVRELMHLALLVPPSSRFGLHTLTAPFIDQGSARIHVGFVHDESEDHHDETWAKMEKDLLQYSTKRFHRRSVSAVVKLNRANDCAVGEPAFLDIRLSNHLQIPVMFSGVEAVALFEGQATEKPFHCEAVDVLLAPVSSVVLRLQITPLTPGLLKVRGIRANFFQRLPVVLPIDPPKIKGARRGAMDESKALDIFVCGPMPLLECDFVAPKDLVAGEVVPCKLKLSNAGKTDMKNLRIKCSHPASLHFSDPSTSQSEPSISNAMKDLSVWEVPLSSLGPGASSELSVWVRGVDVGSMTLRLVFYYEPVGGTESIKHRFLHFSTHVQVEPSLQMSLTTSPYPCSVNAHLVNVLLSNCSSSSTIFLNDLVCGSFQWNGLPIEGLPSTLGKLLPGGATQLTFRIEPSISSDKKDFAFGNVFAASSSDFSIPRGLVCRFLERESSERILAGPEELQPNVLFGDSSLQVLLFWSFNNNLGNGNNNNEVNRIGMSSALEIIPGGSNMMKGRVGPGVQSVTPGAPGQVLGNSLRFTLHFPRSVNHSFQANSLCFLNGHALVHNSSSSPLSCTLQSHAPCGAMHSRVCYFWCGKTCQRISVPAGKTVQVPVTIGFPCEGVYNIDRFQLSFEDQVVVPQETCVVDINAEK